MVERQRRATEFRRIDLNPKHPPGPPMTLKNMRELGVQNLIASCLNDACRHQALIDVSSYAARHSGPLVPNQSEMRQMRRPDRRQAELAGSIAGDRLAWAAGYAERGELHASFHRALLANRQPHRADRFAMGV